MNIQFNVGEGGKPTCSKGYSYFLLNSKLFSDVAKMTKKFFAFTLAETLIVMGIIGVVAALTLPNLNSSTANKEKVVKLQKLYQNLNDAYGRATAVYGPIDTWPKDGDMSNRFADRLKDFLKVAKYCDKEHIGECIDTDNEVPGMILPDGSSMLLWANLNCVGDELMTLGPSCGTIEVDIDGPNRGKSYHGVDIHSFLVTKDNGIIPRWSRDTKNGNYPKDCYKYNTPSDSPIWKNNNCTAWVIENGNMDYLIVDKSGKCPNSSIVLDGTTNTTCK